MRLVTEYQRRAEECYSLALTVVTEDHRTLIRGMAEMWEILARQREALLKNAPNESILDELPWREGAPHVTPTAQSRTRSRQP